MGKGGGFSLGDVCLNGVKGNTWDPWPLKKVPLRGFKIRKAVETNSQILTTAKVMFSRNSLLLMSTWVKGYYVGFYLISCLDVPLGPQVRGPICQTETTRPRWAQKTCTKAKSAWSLRTHFRMHSLHDSSIASRCALSDKAGKGPPGPAVSTNHLSSHFPAWRMDFWADSGKLLDWFWAQ